MDEKAATGYRPRRQILAKGNFLPISIRAIIRPLVITAFFTALGIWVFAPFFIATLISILDLRSRYLDFQRFKNQRYATRLSKELSKSWCSRGVAEAIWPEAIDEYHTAGHRFYHLFQVGFPWVFFDIRFIKSVVGIGKRTRP